MTLRSDWKAMIAHAFPHPEPDHMVMPPTVPWTRRDLDRLPDDGNRYEVLNGELFVTPAPSDAHQAIVYWLNGVLTPFVVTHGLGQVQFPRGVIVIGGSQLEPDLMVRPHGPLHGWENAPIPIMVIEVLSRSTRQRDLKEKRALYIEKGIDEYWVIDRDERVVHQITSIRSDRVSGTLTWSPKAIDGTLEIDVVAMFSRVS
jgi:Uma2 family endonuclease